MYRFADQFLESYSFLLLDLKARRIESIDNLDHYSRTYNRLLLLDCSSVDVYDHEIFVILAVNLILLLVSIHDHLINVCPLSSLVLIYILQVLWASIANNR